VAEGGEGRLRRHVLEDLRRLRVNDADRAPRGRHQRRAGRDSAHRLRRRLLLLRRLRGLRLLARRIGLLRGEGQGHEDECREGGQG
jgi:hypothetical protein